MKPLVLLHGLLGSAKGTKDLVAVADGLVVVVPEAVADTLGEIAGGADLLAEDVLVAVGVGVGLAGNRPSAEMLNLQSARLGASCVPPHCSSQKDQRLAETANMGQLFGLFGSLACQQALPHVLAYPV